VRAGKPDYFRGDRGSKESDVDGHWEDGGGLKARVILHTDSTPSITGRRSVVSGNRSQKRRVRGGGCGEERIRRTNEYPKLSQKQWRPGRKGGWG